MDLGEAQNSTNPVEKHLHSQFILSTLFWGDSQDASLPAGGTASLRAATSQWCSGDYAA